MKNVAENRSKVKTLEPRVRLEPSPFWVFIFLPARPTDDAAHALYSTLRHAIDGLLAGLNIKARVVAALPIDDAQSETFVRYDLENADLNDLLLLSSVAGEVVPGARVQWARRIEQASSEEFEGATFPYVAKFRGPYFCTASCLEQVVNELALERAWSVTTEASEDRFTLTVWDSPTGVSTADVRGFLDQMVARAWAVKTPDLELELIA
jgi:hypothetical protein